MLYVHCYLDRNKLVFVLCACTLSLSGVGAEFSQQPSNVTVREGQSTSLTCALSNTGTIQWTLEAVIISPTNPLFSIATNDTSSELRIVRADHTLHSGYYQCMASGFVSVSALVLVQYLSDDIRIDRTLVTAYEGGSASFVCSPPAGVPSPTVRWKTDGSLLTQNQHVSLSLDNTMLQLDVLMMSDSGIYYCVAENGLGKSVNTSAELRVQRTALQLSDAQYAVTIPFAQFCAKAGNPLSIDCLITPQPKMEMVRWLRNGYVLTSGKDGYYLRQNFTLKINSVSAQHMGAYCCVVEAMGMVAKHCTEVLMSCSDKLKVTVTPPYFTPSWTLLLNFSYSNVMLKGGGASGSMVSWFKGDVPLLQNKRISYLPNGSLLLYDMQLQLDLGYYTAISVHTSNTVFTTSVALPATATPALQLLASSSVIQLQSSITLVCSFTSNAYRGFSFTWFLNNFSSPVLGDTRHSIYSTSLNSTLYVSNVGSVDVGTYLCAAPEANVTASVHISLASYLYLLPITFTQQPTTVCNGSTLSLECPFGGGRGTTNVSWSLNSKPLVNGVGGVKLAQDGRMLMVVSSQPQNAGIYACNVSDGFTTFYQTLPVAVIVPGNIEAVYSTPEAVEGSSVRFDCIVSGMASQHVIWLRGWVPVYDLNDSSLVQLPNGSLLINPVTSKDENTYYCAIQVCHTLDIKQFFFKVLPGNTSTPTSAATLMVDDIVLLAGLVFSGLMLAIAAAIFVGVCCCYYHDRVRERRTNTVRQRAQLAGALRRQASMRVSGRRDQGGSSMLAHETTTFTNGKAKGISLATSDTSASQPTPALQAPPTPTPTPVSTSTAISIDSHDRDHQLPNYPRTNLQLSKVIGEGEFGPVTLAWAHNISSLERSEVAVKVLLPPSAGAPRLHPNALLSDFASQMQLQHSNICAILGLCTDTEPYYIIYEYLDKGDLKRSLLEARETHNLAQKDLCNIVAQVADGMAFLYSQRIIHGDLATRNCLLSSEMKVKIADLGIGHDLYHNDYFDNGSQLLPIRWMAPELFTANASVGPNFSLHSDVWSFGVFCWEVFTYASQPYEGLTDLQVLDQVPRGHTLTPLAKLCPPLFHSIMQSCWSYKIDERPKFSTLSIAIRKVTLEN